MSNTSSPKKRDGQQTFQEHLLAFWIRDDASSLWCACAARRAAPSRFDSRLSGSQGSTIPCPSLLPLYFLPSPPTVLSPFPTSVAGLSSLTGSSQKRGLPHGVPQANGYLPVVRETAHTAVRSDNHHAASMMGPRAKALGHDWDRFLPPAPCWVSSTIGRQQIKNNT